MSLSLGSGTPRKRPRSPTSSSSKSHLRIDRRDSEFLCPVCFNVISDAYVTKCGHSFCHACIVKSLKESNRCPKCNLAVNKVDDIFPNFALSELISRCKQQERDFGKHKNFTNLSAINGLQENLSLIEINFWLKALEDRKRHLELGSAFVQHQLTLEFLHQIKNKKQQEFDQLQQELRVIDEDLCQIQGCLTRQRSSKAVKLEKSEVGCVASGDVLNSSGLWQDTVGEAGFNGSLTSGCQSVLQMIASQKKELHIHFGGLETAYCKTRIGDFTDSTRDGLESFSKTLMNSTRFNDFRTLASLTYGEVPSGSSIVSSIEFSKESDYFAIAGVTKKIKVFDYNIVIDDPVDIHYPVKEMVCNSKISCISWNMYHKEKLASSDYDGMVTVWDAFSGEKAIVFQEHEKRCWSVDFNMMDAKLLASGSDDGKVKVWSTEREHSVACIEAKANVCCVQFNPRSRFHLAFGSADHCIHYYDLRNTKEQLCVLKGHKKAVSYVKFMDQDVCVSASTDSQLKLWNVADCQCLRTFCGHINEKNFVGLAKNGDFVACGSENNSLCIYYKGLSELLLSHRFGSVRTLLEKAKKDEETNDFVSAVSWKPDSNVIIAANSQGVIKLLEMV
ncbi:E3 ubiquitin-protein ligase COP1-like [Corticium candelabrum]|uniref:E3 ubiquitin-protein ligase COP1-like n=1 Tax=Corticium candelabrum TaxID=121492 RepID=UPI002E264D40|nr:E3 ubiquitin-protein ligase COP1-like [Corticium candelabrum]